MRGEGDGRDGTDDPHPARCPRGQRDQQQRWYVQEHSGGEGPLTPGYVGWVQHPGLAEGEQGEAG